MLTAAAAAAAHMLIRLTEVSSPHHSVPALYLAPANRVVMLSAHIYQLI
jgi:hypothetical protein